MCSSDLMVLLKGVGRVACAEAADLDGDGDLDVVVCVFGHLDGKTLWLEQTGNLEFVEHVLDDRPGTIHAFPIDADGARGLDRPRARAMDASPAAPARCLGIQAGQLETGRPASLCVLDAAATRAMASQWLSAGRNSPWLDATLPGVVKLTVCHGRLSWRGD